MFWVWPIWNITPFNISESEEVDAIKKQYTKLTDAYGCLGVLQLSLSKHFMINFLLRLLRNHQQLMSQDKYRVHINEGGRHIYVIQVKYMLVILHLQIFHKVTSHYSHIL